MARHFEHKGHDFTVTYEHDDNHGEPWKECDGHGIISEWTARDKRAGERVIASDGSRKRFYDIEATMKLARRDGWGLAPDELAKLTVKLGRTPTKREVTAESVERDYEFLRGWCDNEWHYVGVIVALAKFPDEDRALWGVESNSASYLDEVARELADELLRELPNFIDNEVKRLQTVKAQLLETQP